MDVVYVVGPGERQWLRHSLRSLVNLPHDNVHIVGEVPGWVNRSFVNYIPTRHMTPKWRSATHNLLTASLNTDISESFILMNDDFFVMDKIEGVPALHRGPLSEVHEEVRAKLGESPWVEGMAETHKLLQELGVGDPLCYELHVPMVFVKSLLEETIQLNTRRRRPDIQTAHTRTMYGNMWNIGGTKIADVKLHRKQDTVVTTTPFLSTSPYSWGAATSGHIKKMFREKCEYEAF